MTREVLPLPLLILLPVAVLTLGCVSSRSTEKEAATQAAVLGTWRYHVAGFAPLDQGVLRIFRKNGRLQALLRDQRGGRFRADVKVYGSRMELIVGRLLISGRIENGHFSGYLRPQRWDVSVASYRRQRRARFRTTSFYAKRIRGGAAAEAVPALECQSILREANGCK